MGNTAGGLAFDVGEEVTSYANGSQRHWKLHKGSRKTNGEPVSIFRLDKKGSAGTLALEAGQRGFQKLRSLRHPYVLQCLDAVELDAEAVLATEEVVTLTEWAKAGGGCETGKKDDQVAWGMHCVFSALKFLHEDCKLSHSNLCPDTIFVTRGGDWKVGGMDLLGPLDAKDYFLQGHDDLLPREFRAPERLRRDWSIISGAGYPVHGLDIWSFGRVLEVLYPAGLPDELRKYVQRMQAEPPAKRPSAGQYLRCAFLKRPIVKSLSFLETFSIKSPEEKAVFFKEFQIADYPKQVLQHRLAGLILGELTAVIPPPGVVATPANARGVVTVGLVPLLEICQDMDDVAFENRVQPVLMGLCSLNDRGVRAAMLTRLDMYGKRLTDKAINEKMFEPLCAGFTDASAPLRELTLKSMVVFADRLNERNMNEKLIRALTKLQADPEDSIRTNTIIFLGKIARQLKPAVRDKVLLAAFYKGIKDPFPACKLAGLRALAACQSYFRPEEVCAKVLPAVMPCLIEATSAMVRDAAFQCVEAYMKSLRELSEQMKVDEEEQRKREAEGRVSEAGGLAGAGGAGAASAASANISRAQAAPNGTANAGNDGSTWSSWAFTKLSEKVLSSAMPVGPMTTAPNSATVTPAITSPPTSQRTGVPPAMASPIRSEEAWEDARENAADGWDDFSDGEGNGAPAPVRPAGRLQKASSSGPAGLTVPPGGANSGEEGAGLLSLLPPTSKPARVPVKGMTLKGPAPAASKPDAIDPWSQLENDLLGGSGPAKVYSRQSSTGSTGSLGSSNSGATTATATAGPPVHPAATSSAASREARKQELELKRQQKRAQLEKKKLAATKLPVEKASADGWEDF